jgi:hypothetical protein
MSNIYLIQVAAAFVGMLFGFLIVSVFLLRTRCKRAEDRLEKLEFWASSVSPVIMGLVVATGISIADINEAQNGVRH